MIKQGKDFKVWTENGKYFIKTSKLGRKQEISQVEFKDILANETIRSIGFSDQSLGIDKLIKHYNEHCDEATSEFGRRVNVVIVEEEQKSSKNDGVDVHFKLEVLDEETGETADDLFTITSDIEGITGVLTDKGVNYPEAFRSLYQLAFNGYLAINEEHNKVKTALKL